MRRRMICREVRSLRGRRRLESCSISIETVGGPRIVHVVKILCLLSSAYDYMISRDDFLIN